MSKIFILYAMVSEDNKEIKLNGPFIHFSFIENENDENDKQYLFDKNRYLEEKGYLSRYLREKYPHKISIFHFVEYQEIDGKDLNYVMKNAMVDAGKHFENKFEIMKDNYSICSRRK